LSPSGTVGLRVTVNDPATSVPKPTASSEGSETAMAGVFVFVFGLLAALYSQYSALTNEYVIHNDVRQWLYYVQQWANPELFQDDLLTELTKALQPWGMTLVYRAASLFVDPLYFSKLLPVILLPIAAWYFFRLVELRAGLFAGLLGGVIFIVVPAFLHGMVGGLSRSFGFPLLLAFLFYQSKEDYPKSALVLVLQALVHPMTSVVCVASYGLSFLHVRRPYVALPPLKSGCYAAACLAVGLILGLKYLSPPNPSLGSVTMRAAMVGKPEFYKGAGIRGRTKVLPVEPMYQMAVKSTLDPLIGRAMVQRYRRGVGPVSSFLKESHKIALYLIFIAAPFYLVWEARKKKIRIPWPIVHIVLASLVLYQLANLVFFKLYAPSRYLVFSMPVVGVFLFSTVLATWVGRLPAGRVRRFVQVTLLVILMIQVPLHKDMLLTDESDRKDLFVFLSSPAIASWPRTPSPPTRFPCCPEEPYSSTTNSPSPTSTPIGRRSSGERGISSPPTTPRTPAKLRPLAKRVGSTTWSWRGATSARSTSRRGESTSIPSTTRFSSRSRGGGISRCWMFPRSRLSSRRMESSSSRRTRWRRSMAVTPTRGSEPATGASRRCLPLHPGYGLTANSETSRKSGFDLPFA
jgi:hypothetical protein